MKSTMVALIIAGICAWVVAAIIGLLSNASSKFLWTCVTGAALGIVGIIYTVRRDRRSAI
jgi:O-antigen/teichoic acid export membrane protein